MTTIPDSLKLKYQGRGAVKNAVKEMLTIVSIGGEFVTSTLAYVGNLFTDLSLLIYLIIGLPLGFWVVRKVVSLVRTK